MLHSFGLEFAGTLIIDTTNSLYTDGWSKDSAPLSDNWTRNNG